MSSVLARLFDTKVAQNPQPDSPHTFREKTGPDTHKPKHSIENTPALNIVHISVLPCPRPRQPPSSSQITNRLNIRHFRLILPSSLCLSLRPSRRAISSRQTQCPKTHFPLKTPAKSLKHGAPVLSCGHNSDPAGSVQNLVI